MNVWKWVKRLVILGIVLVVGYYLLLFLLGLFIILLPFMQ